MTVFFKDAYTTQAVTPRDKLIAEITRLRMLSWADPADRSITEEIERLKAELLALDLAAGESA